MDAAELGRSSTTGADIRGLFAAADVGSWVALRDGQLAAFGSLRHLPAPGELRAEFACLPGAARAGGAILERLAREAVARQAGSISLWQVAEGIAAPWLEARGWARVRRYLRMGIDLERRGVPPRDGAVRVEQASGEAARRVVHELIEETLVGHWDHVSLGYDEFYAAQAARPGHDPSLWYLGILDGEPAGAIVARLIGRDGLIALLGTRERFRGRGVATSLLLHVFDELAARGAGRAYLDVDTGNASEAARVYERAGMRVELASDQWRLDLRTQSAARLPAR